MTKLPFPHIKTLTNKPFLGKEMPSFDPFDVEASYLVVGCDGVSESNTVKIVKATSQDEAISKFKCWVLAMNDEVHDVHIIDASPLQLELTTRIA